MEQYLYNGIFIVGSCTTAYLLLKFASSIYKLLKVYAWNTSPNFSKYGKWSVVTGSTDGIGKALAFQLASRGQCIVLIARNQEKLQNVADEIRSKYDVSVKTLKIDFDEDESIYEEIKAFLQGLDIGILINNVGHMSPLIDFLDIPDLSTHVQSVVRVNVVSLLKMHQIVLPGMVERKRGLILNISSTTALQPMFPVYGASKAFVDHFSQALSYEYEDKGVTIQACLPALVQTKMTSDVPPTPHTVQPEHYASSLMCWIGKERQCHGCIRHEVVGWIMRHLPQGIFALIWKRSKNLRGERKKKE